MAGGLELAFEVQRLFTGDPAKVSSTPILPGGIFVANRCVWHGAIKKEKDASVSSRAASSQLRKDSLRIKVGNLAAQPT
jgi:hypothetical protein